MGYIHVEILSANNLKRLFLARLTPRGTFYGNQNVKLYLPIKKHRALITKNNIDKKKYTDRYISNEHKLPSKSLAGNDEQQRRLINDLKGVTPDGAAAHVAHEHIKDFF